MQLEWWEHKDFQWVCTEDEGNMVLAQIKHYPTGWKLTWRPSTKRGVKWQDKDWPDTELEEAKAWAIAMIRMSQ
jgi:hypothetical protein